MSLLHEIQAALLQEGTSLAPILLKLRLLAARLGSQPLAEWIRHESEGYPESADIPSYRIIPAAYTANFSGPLGSAIRNAPIPQHIVQQLAGEKWVNYEVRESIAAIDDIITMSKISGVIEFNAHNLIFRFQGKVYETFACNSVTGSLSRASFASIRHTVSSRVLELTIELEKSFQDISLVTINPTATLPSTINAATVSQITQQIIFGNMTAITSNGDNAAINVSVTPRDEKSLEQFLISSGMAKEDAEELANLAASESPDNTAEPMGPRVRNWLVDNLKKAASGTWKMGIVVATDIIKESLLKFYDLK